MTVAGGRSKRRNYATPALVIVASGADAEQNPNKGLPSSGSALRHDRVREIELGTFDQNTLACFRRQEIAGTFVCGA